MRITYLHQYFNTPDMSGGTRSYEMARRLVAKGHKVNIITTFREEEGRRGWFETDEANIKVHWLPVRYSNYMPNHQRIAAFCRFAWSAAKKSASIPADVVFATSTPLTIALPAVYCKWRQKVPMVFEVRDLWPELPIAIGALNNPLAIWGANKLEKFAYDHSHSVVALSPGMKAGVERSAPSPKEVAMIPNSCDLAYFYPDIERGKAFRRSNALPADRFLVTYGGTFGKINGVDYLARVANFLKEDERFHFLLIGDGLARPHVETLSAELGVLEKNLSIFPQVTKAKMADVLAATDIATSLFLPLPEMEANSANKFFDGLAAGCCMAINYGGWHAELLEETRAGLRLDADPHVGARQLAEFVGAPNRVREAGQRARELAERRFSRDRLANELESVLVNAVKAKRQ